MTENKAIFTGQSRILFLLLALVLLAQCAVFLRGRVISAFDILRSDFKVAVVLNNASTSETQSFTKKLNSLKGVSEVRYLNAKEALSLPGAAPEQNGFEVFLPKEDFLPAFFELKVKDEVLMNPSAWVSEHFSRMPQDAQAYYKESQAQLAVYLSGLMKFVNILLALSGFFFFSFCFFVEAYYTRITSLSQRFSGVLCALLAYGVSLVFCFIITSPLNIIKGGVFTFEFGPQVAVLIFGLMLGWTLAKWKKF